jgi:hypothetical protein
MQRPISGIILSVCGLLLFLFRMPLVYQLVGRFKTRVALLLGIDKLQIFLAVLWIVAMSLFLGGIVLIVVGLRGKKSGTTTPVTEG